MRLHQHLKNNEFVLLYELLDILYYIKEKPIITEGIVPDILFNSISNLGSKLGFKIKRTNSLFTYLSKAEDNLTDLVTYLTLYALANNSKQREELKDDIKNQLAHINKKELTDFFMMLDKGFFGLSSLLRNFLISVFGVEITTYKKWVGDLEFIQNKLKEIKIALLRLNPTKEEMSAFEDFENIINIAIKNSNITEEITGCTSGATTTDNVEKFWPKMGPTTRRKRNKKLRNKLL